MKKLLFGILTIGSLSAQASIAINGPLDAEFDIAQENDEKTYFEKLGELFKTGTRPTLSKISNIAWAGRCFVKDEENKPVNAGYIIRQKKINSDVGPIASNNKSYEAFSYWKIHKDPNYFDKMNIEQVFAAIPELPKYGSDVKIKSDSIEITVNASNKSNLKVSGSYLVEEISGPSEDVGPVGNIIVGTRCYYFIPDLND